MSRYIDADALMERFAEMQKVKPDKDGREYACNFRNMGDEPSAEWFTVEDAVENAPTVDAVPVGWIENYVKWLRKREIHFAPKAIETMLSYYKDSQAYCDSCGERRTDEQ